MSESTADPEQSKPSKGSKHARTARAARGLDRSILEARPRGGGYRHPFGINDADDENTCTCGDEPEEEPEVDDDPICYCDIQEKSDINVMANVFTVIMLLASGNKPTDAQLRICMAMLATIKTDDGLTPPNVQGLMNHILLTMPDGDSDYYGSSSGNTRSTKTASTISPIKSAPSSKSGTTSDTTGTTGTSSSSGTGATATSSDTNDARPIKKVTTTDTSKPGTRRTK